MTSTPATTAAISIGVSRRRSVKTVMSATAPTRRTDEDRRDEPMRVLDPGVEVGRRHPVTEAQRPVGAAQPGVGGAHEPTHGDEHEGGDGSSDRKLGETGHVGFLSPLVGRRGERGRAMIARAVSA